MNESASVPPAPHSGTVIALMARAAGLDEAAGRLAVAECAVCRDAAGALTAKADRLRVLAGMQMAADSAHELQQAMARLLGEFQQLRAAVAAGQVAGA